MSRRIKHLAPSIYLDEIDVLQMAFAAMEMALKDPPLETFGLLLGEIERRRRRLNFRVQFIQIIQRAKRTAYPPTVLFDEKRLAHLSKRYNFQVLGDFHSHPSIYSSYPSHSDLKDVISRYPQNSVFAVLLVHKRDTVAKDNGHKNAIVRRKTKIVCYLAEFVIHINFFAFKEGIEAVPRNIAPRKLIRRVYPRCFVRKKIHKDKHKIKKRLTIV
ncbi:MAG: Mov34/MPN/PAD-1 family protein [Parcubacteria group bacterium]|nr:Mov34/MPN/PAD-1 family protein [Parcubacteria group bacterium]